MRAKILSAALLVVILLQGCTLHFKATDVELDTEAQQSQNNVTYELYSASLLHGEDRQ